MVDRKGISPLIATVLIIGFTIVVAVLVITWITNTVEDLTCVESCNIEGQNLCRNFVTDVEVEWQVDNLVVSNSGSQDYSLFFLFFKEGDETIGSAPETILRQYAVITIDDGDFIQNEGQEEVPFTDAVYTKVMSSVSVSVEDCDDCDAFSCGSIEEEK